MKRVINTLGKSKCQKYLHRHYVALPTIDPIIPQLLNVHLNKIKTIERFKEYSSLLKVKIESNTESSLTIKRKNFEDLVNKSFQNSDIESTLELLRLGYEYNTQVLRQRYNANNNDQIPFNKLLSIKPTLSSKIFKEILKSRNPEWNRHLVTSLAPYVMEDGRKLSALSVLVLHMNDINVTLSELKIQTADHQRAVLYWLLVLESHSISHASMVDTRQSSSEASYLMPNKKLYNALLFKIRSWDTVLYILSSMKQHHIIPRKEVYERLIDMSSKFIPNRWIFVKQFLIDYIKILNLPPDSSSSSIISDTTTSSSSTNSSGGSSNSPIIQVEEDMDNNINQTNSRTNIVDQTIATALNIILIGCTEKTSMFTHSIGDPEKAWEVITLWNQIQLIYTNTTMGNEMYDVSRNMKSTVLRDVLSMDLPVCDEILIPLATAVIYVNCPSMMLHLVQVMTDTKPDVPPSTDIINSATHKSSTTTTTTTVDNTATPDQHHHHHHHQEDDVILIEIYETLIRSKLFMHQPTLIALIIAFFLRTNKSVYAQDIWNKFTSSYEYSEEATSDLRVEILYIISHLFTHMNLPYNTLMDITSFLSAIMVHNITMINKATNPDDTDLMKSYRKYKPLKLNETILNDMIKLFNLTSDVAGSSALFMACFQQGIIPDLMSIMMLLNKLNDTKEYNDVFELTELLINKIQDQNHPNTTTSTTVRGNNTRVDSNSVVSASITIDPTTGKAIYQKRVSKQMINSNSDDNHIHHQSVVYNKESHKRVYQRKADDNGQISITSNQYEARKSENTTTISTTTTSTTTTAAVGVKKQQLQPPVVPVVENILYKAKRTEYSSYLFNPAIHALIQTQKYELAMELIQKELPRFEMIPNIYQVKTLIRLKGYTGSYEEAVKLFYHYFVTNKRNPTSNTMNSAITSESMTGSNSNTTTPNTPLSFEINTSGNKDEEVVFKVREEINAGLIYTILQICARGKLGADAIDIYSMMNSQNKLMQQIRQNVAIKTTFMKLVVQALATPQQIAVLPSFVDTVLNDNQAIRQMLPISSLLLECIAAAASIQNEEVAIHFLKLYLSWGYCLGPRFVDDMMKRIQFILKGTEITLPRVPHQTAENDMLVEDRDIRIPSDELDHEQLPHLSSFSTTTFHESSIKNTVSNAKSPVESKTRHDKMTYNSNSPNVYKTIDDTQNVYKAVSYTDEEKTYVDFLSKLIYKLQMS